MPSSAQQPEVRLGEQRLCPEGHSYLAVVIGDAEPVCPACEVRPAYGEVIQRLAATSFTVDEYLKALDDLDLAMPGKHDSLDHAEEHHA